MPPAHAAPRLPTFPRDGVGARAFLIYEDARILAFDKPAGLSVQGGSGVEANLDAMLAAFARGPSKQPRLAHRLDRETSGVIVAGRTHAALVFLNRAFADRRTAKTYLALVCGGAPDPAEGVATAPLIKTKARGVDVVRAARPGEAGAQTAETAYRTLASSPAAALVEVRPRTGRMHQIRAHLALLGRPIAGDGKYGGLFMLGGVAAPHLLLHALALDAPHPDGGRLRLTAPPPPAFAAAAAALGFADALPDVPVGGARIDGEAT
ncbi:MAG: RNA pseudouridine synthase [Hyphomonadaceae bacterium]|nr:RNA pseudouridine synthase [Hyphomonadaceae bacterium]